MFKIKNHQHHVGGGEIDDELSEECEREDADWGFPDEAAPSKQSQDYRVVWPGEVNWDQGNQVISTEIK